jgi:hypothetical protein
VNGKPIRVDDDYAMRAAALNDHLDVVHYLTARIFLPELWKEKELREIKAEASRLTDAIKETRLSPARATTAADIVVAHAERAFLMEQERRRDAQRPLINLPRSAFMV